MQKELALVQISTARAGSHDSICVSIIQDGLLHMRAELSLEDFARSMTSGMKVQALITRKRIINTGHK